MWSWRERELFGPCLGMLSSFRRVMNMVTASAAQISPAQRSSQCVLPNFHSLASRWRRPCGSTPSEDTRLTTAPSTLDRRQFIRRVLDLGSTGAWNEVRANRNIPSATRNVRLIRYLPTTFTTLTKKLMRACKQEILKMVLLTL